ncbi:hypothetical protein BG53_02325 [Paenibacillus darwinianus]|uniref:Uncharacterized protein n=1 Tax=Paenibacillus darwinianus TaxID=1380763 RepID=A0A9W5S0B8_9BACL|nr:ABC transporter ATP-binding protein [Paenibacillus darwinianus]EXX87827.1 hypothetical protein BG52_03150 [Paenibacillus darwinianus]EXX88217.1 hypothetical protein BG53_02325 [Paenibacillus darwinianus]EXX89073.1 hypothetical protein CH50_02150 [Paenibacillus darwinianus]
MSFLYKMRWFFRTKWPVYTAAIILMVVSTLLNTIAPRIIGSVIDSIRSGTLTEASLMRTVWLLIGLAVAVYVTFYIFSAADGSRRLRGKAAGRSA